MVCIVHLQLEAANGQAAWGSHTCGGVHGLGLRRRPVYSEIGPNRYLIFSLDPPPTKGPPPDMKSILSPPLSPTAYILGRIWGWQHTRGPNMSGGRAHQIGPEWGGGW